MSENMVYILCYVCFIGFLLSTKECMREMWSVRSRCPITQAAWDRGLPPPAKMRQVQPYLDVGLHLTLSHIFLLLLLMELNLIFTVINIVFLKYIEPNEHFELRFGCAVCSWHWCVKYYCCDALWAWLTNWFKCHLQGDGISPLVQTSVLGKGVKHRPPPIKLPPGSGSSSSGTSATC